jgi:hypothetical protein
MKKTLLFIGLSLLSAAFSAQVICCPYVSTPTLIPQNPTDQDQVKVIVEVTTPNQGSQLSSQLDIIPGQKQVNITNCYWPGLATALKTFRDTLSLGLLPGGSWKISLMAYSSSSDQSCEKADSNRADLQFVVTSLTGFSEHRGKEEIGLFPNPVSDKLFLSGISGSPEVSIFSLNGSLIRTTRLNGNETTVGDLLPGVYVIRIGEEREGRSFRKFIKE